MKRFTFCVAVLSAIALGGGAWAGSDKPDPQPRLEVDLVDGSHIIGTPGIESVAVETSYAKMDVQLRQILTIRIGEDRETASIELRNGDKLKGVVNLGTLELDTAFGKVSVGPEHIKSLRVVLACGSLPAGEGSISFGGVNWVPWRTAFEVQGDKLVSLPKARPGFNYGHGGNGRGATLVSNVGSAEWKDYSMEFEYGMRGVDPAFNPHGLPLDHRAGYIMFHVADAKESWNQRGTSLYTLGLGADGTWGLSCYCNLYCPTSSGWSNPHIEGNRALAQGSGLKLDPQAGNKFRIDVCGTRIQVWVDGKQIADVTDDKMGECVGGQTLDHGGVGFGTPWECMIWIRNFSVRAL